MSRPRRPLRRSVAVCGLALATLSATVVPAALAASDPASPVPAPAVVEGPSPYLGQVSCDPVAKPGTLALKAMLLASYGGGSLGIVRDCALGGTSEHKEGRAFDWALSAASPADRVLAAQFLSWLTATGPDGQAGYNARRLGVMYAIWNRQIWSVGNAAAGWRPYTGVSPHTDHVHISLSWAGAMQRTSFWTGTASAVDYGPCRVFLHLPAPKYTGPRATPCGAPRDPLTLTGIPLRAMGSSGGYVYQLQVLLHVSPDGGFGATTRTALMAFQVAHGLPGTGATDPATWAALRVPTPAPVPIDPATMLAPFRGLTITTGATGPAVVALQTVLRLPADGAFGPQTATAVNAFKVGHTMAADGVVDPPVWIALGAPAVAAPAPQPAPAPVPVPVPVPKPTPTPRPAPKVSPLARFAGLTLRTGSHGPAVRALQRTLHVTADGAFGRRTRAAVRAFEKRHRLHVDGVVTRRDWKALGA